MEGQKALRFHHEDFTGLEWHEGEQLMTEFSFLGELSFKIRCPFEGTEGLWQAAVHIKGTILFLPIFLW